MSRIGNLPIEIPEGASINIDENNLVSVKGPKGELSQQVDPEIKIYQIYSIFQAHNTGNILIGKIAPL